MTSPRIEHIGEATLCLGDCRSVMGSLPTIAAVITDPPYGNSNHIDDYNHRLNTFRGIEDQPIANDDAQGMREVVDVMLHHAAARLDREASACCCFCGGGGRRRCLLGWQTGWTVTGCNSFTR